MSDPIVLCDANVLYSILMTDLILSLGEAIEGRAEIVLTYNLRDFGSVGDRQEQLRLFWAASSALAQPLGVQERTVTEWAALGLACVVLARYTPLRVSQVAADGDRFDYWVSDGEREYGLE